MASNKFLTIADISYKSADSLHNAFGFTKKVNRSYDDRFAKTGAKIGSVTNARLPTMSRFSADTSSVNIDIQALNDKGMPVSLNKNYQRAFAIDEVDMALSIDDFSERYLNPHLLSLSAEIDRDGLLLARQYAQNTVGTPGTLVNSLAEVQALFAGARRKLVENLAPAGSDLYMAATPGLNELGYTYMTSLFNPQGGISDLQTAGIVGTASGLKFFETQQVPTYSAGTYSGTPVTNGANQSGGTLVTNGWGAGTTLDVGAVFTVAGVFAVNAQSKASLGYLQQFTVTAKNAAGAAQTLSISPEIVGPGEARQNVSALPANGAAIVVVGATTVVADMGIAFHKDAFIFATADIAPPTAGAEGYTASAPELGLSICVSKQFDIRSRQTLMRLDVLGGWAPLYPQLATKVIYS